MIEISTKLRRWGNSYGIVVPIGSIPSNIKENDDIKVFISKEKPELKKLFGRLKDWNIDSQDYKDSIRKQELKKRK
jgi:hypothetical protein